MWTRGRGSVESKASKYIISSISPEFCLNCDFVKSKHGITAFKSEIISVKVYHIQDIFSIVR